MSEIPDITTNFTIYSIGSTLLAVWCSSVLPEYCAFDGSKKRRDPTRLNPSWKGSNGEQASKTVKRKLIPVQSFASWHIPLTKVTHIPLGSSFIPSFHFVFEVVSDTFPTCPALMRWLQTQKQNRFGLFFPDSHDRYPKITRE